MKIRKEFAMFVRDVLAKYNKKIPFPWTLSKIKKAGFEPKDFFIKIGNELEKCEDVETGLADKIVKSITALRNQN